MESRTPKKVGRSEAATAVGRAATSLPAIVESGGLACLEAGAKRLMLRRMMPLQLKAGQKVFRPGDVASSYLVVTSGSIKVLVTTEQGRDIVLYRVGPGETCVLTTACLLGGGAYEAEGIAAEETEAILIPKSTFQELLAVSPAFRQFVFASYGERLHTLIGLVQEVAVRHVDRRLARHLVGRVREGVVIATHQALAEELNTAREVVTRLLNEFAHKNWVEVSRGRVLIRDERALREFAGPTL